MAEQQSSQPPIEFQSKRLKLAWRALLIFNFSMGAYIFSRPRKKETNAVNRHKASEKQSHESKANAKAKEKVQYEMATTSGPPIEPVSVQDLVTEDQIQRRGLFEWAFGRERKVKPKDHEEKQWIEEDNP